MILQKTLPLGQTSVVFRWKGCQKKALTTGSHTLTDKQPEKPAGDFFNTRFGEAKDNIEQKIKKIAGSGLGLKGIADQTKQSQSKLRTVNDILTVMEKKKK